MVNIELANDQLVERLSLTPFQRLISHLDVCATVLHRLQIVNAQRHGHWDDEQVFAAQSVVLGLNAAKAEFIRTRNQMKRVFSSPIMEDDRLTRFGLKDY